MCNLSGSVVSHDFVGNNDEGVQEIAREKKHAILADDAEQRERRRNARDNYQWIHDVKN
jgi:hypothetical protein